MKKPLPIKTKRPKVRDELLLDLINGVTKAAVHKDRKKELDKKRCRRKIDEG